jgi:SAM-dependent methyltransferase
MRMLKRVAKSLIQAVMARPLPGPFTRLDGHSWSARLTGPGRRDDRSDPPDRSTLVIYENGVPLGPARSHPDDVRNWGHGRFADHGGQVLFSTTDTSDPNTNGRTYTVSFAPWLFRLMDWRQVGAPGNFQQRNATPEQLKADVAYAMQCGKGYRHKVQQLLPELKGKKVLEVGPGINFGSTMYLACYGMTPAVADLYLAPWEKSYHLRFYAALADELERTDPSADVSPLRALVKAGGYDERVIQRVYSSAEELALPDNSVDLILSNAVGEHLADLDRSFRQLYRVTRPGGVGLHQVDFRDHRNFDRPLEYLLLEELEFQALFAAAHAECGNRYRPDEVRAAVEAAGFEVLEFSPNKWVEPAYLEDFLPRLRAARSSRYRDRPAEDLRVISGSYRLRKPA